MNIIKAESGNILIGSYLHSNGDIDNDPCARVIGICVIPSNFLPDGLARFMSSWESKSIWNRDIKVNEDYKEKLPSRDLEEIDRGYLNGPHLVSPYLIDESLNPDYLKDLPHGNAFQDYKGYENTEKYKKKYGNSEELENAFNRCFFSCSPSYRKSEWYLPSIGELALLFWWKKLINTYIKIGSDLSLSPGNALSNSNYWSSSEWDSANAWLVNMGNGFVGNGSKDDSYCVRPFLAL